MRKTKMLLSVLLVVCLCMQCFAVLGSAEGFQSEKLNSLTASEPVKLGKPISDVQILGSTTQVDENGETIVYAVTSGPPAIFFAYNVDQAKVTVQHELTNVVDGKDLPAKVSYAVDMGPDGIINIATQAYCNFYRYNPKTDELKGYGAVFEESAVMTQGVFDSEGNYYFGTYPNAMLVKYNAATDKLEEVGSNMVVGKYVRSMGVYNDKIFMGSMGDPVANFVKYDVKTKKTTEMKNPALDGTFTESDVNNFYAISTAGKYLFARCKIAGSVNAYYLCVFDMEKEEWVDYIPKTLHLHFTDFDGDVVYFHNIPAGAKESHLYSYNPATKEIKEFPEIKMGTGQYLVSPKVVTLKDQTKYPGKSIVAGGGTEGIVIINLEKNSVELIKDVLPANTTQIRTLKAGINDELLISAYMGSKAVVFDTKTDKNKLEFPSLQIEGIREIDGLYYCGMYGKARLQVYDPSKAVKTNENPKYVANMEEQHQDRGLVVVDGGEDVIWASMPDYGRLGGAIGFYNKETGKTRVVAEPIKNQSVGGVAVKDGKIYGSTYVYGGLGIDPIDAPAKLFVMDYETGKVEKEVDIKLTTDKKTQYYAGEAKFAPNGELMVATQKTLLFIDPSTLKINKEVSIGNSELTLIKTRALVYNLAIGQDGLLYTNIGNRITAVDMDTKETKELYNKGTNTLDIVGNGNLYFVDPDIVSVSKIVLSHDAKSADTVLAKSVALMLGKTEALVKGEAKPIDASGAVKATTIEGRTVVPVRFIAESFGAEVGYDEATETVTVKLGDKEIKTVIGEKKITVNGQDISIDVAAFTDENDRTLLPLRAFAESGLGKTIFWQETGVDQGLIVISDGEALNAEDDKAIIEEIVNKFN